MTSMSLKSLLLCGSVVAGAASFATAAQAQNATVNNLINTCNLSQAVTSVSPTNPATSTVTTCLVGGGSTLQFKLNQDLFGSSGDTSTGFQYQGDGSGAGRTAVIAGAPSGTTHSFESTSAAVDFAGSDSSASRFNLAGLNGSSATVTSGSLACAPNAYCYTPTGGGGGPADGPLLQLPLFIAPVAITDHFSSGSLNRNGRFQFTPAQLCGIFSGKINTWSDPALAGILVGTGTPPTGTINVVYRSDALGSGTSTALTTYLAGVCNASNSAITFKATSTFASLFAGGTPPANFYGFDGSDGVSLAVVAGGTSTNGGKTLGTNDNIGYVSSDWTLQATANIGKTAAFPPAALVQNGSTYYAPSAANASVALAADPANPGGGQAAPSNPLDLTTYGPNPTSTTLPSAGYPITVFTYVIFPQCFAGDTLSQAVLNGLATYLGNVPYGAGGAAVAQFSFSTIQGPLLSAVTNVINDSGDPQVGLGDTSVCTGTTSAGSATAAGTGSGRVAHNPPG